MRSFVPGYDLVTPRNLDHALGLLEEHRPFAGGTDLMVAFESGRLALKRFVDIWAMKELRGIDVTPDHVTLGALTTYTDVRHHGVLKGEFPMLCQAAAETGGVAIQNRGTLGGNIVNASPAADTPPALLAYGAEVELTSRKGSRWVAYELFHTGYKQMEIHTDELLTRIRVPRTGGGGVHYYRKVGTRKAQAISKVCFAAYADKRAGTLHDLRIGLGSVAPTVVRAKRAEDIVRARTVDNRLIEAARKAITGDISPIDDIRSTLEYRVRVAANLMEDFLSKSLQA